MNPEVKDRAYQRLFWGTLFLMFLEPAWRQDLPGLPGIIGLCICSSGAGMLSRETGFGSFRAAHRWCRIGIAAWTLQWPAALLFSNNMFPWEGRFAAYFIGAAVVIGLYSNLLLGTRAFVGGRQSLRLGGGSGLFSAVYMISVLTRMANEWLGSNYASAWGYLSGGILFLQILLMIWMMNRLSLARGSGTAAKIT